MEDFSPSPLSSINEAPGSPDDGPPRQRRTSSPWTKHKGPMRASKRQAEREASDEKGDVAVERLATSITHWLRLQPNASAAFSGAGLEPFFDSCPRQRHTVSSTPGILACAIAMSKIEVMVDPVKGKRWLRVPKPVIVTGPPRKALFPTTTASTASSGFC